TRDAVVAFAARARARGAPRVWAFATAALREAADGSAAADAIAAAAGVPVEVLSGEREAALAYAAVAAGETPLLVADVGGRTTELTLGVGERVLGAASLPLGALALTEAHGADLDGAHAAVGAVLAASELPSRARAAGARLAASGGTATALAALALRLGAYVPRRVHGHVLARTALAGLTARLARMTAAERAALPGLDPGRGAILPAGALVLERVADALGADRIVVSDHGSAMPTCARPSRATACRPTSGSSGHDCGRARAGDRRERGAGHGAGRGGGARGRGLARARARRRGGGGARRGRGSRGGARSAGAAPAGG